MLTRHRKKKMTTNHCVGFTATLRDEPIDGILSPFEHSVYDNKTVHPRSIESKLSRDSYAFYKKSYPLPINLQQTGQGLSKFLVT